MLRLHGRRELKGIMELVLHPGAVGHTWDYNTSLGGCTLYRWDYSTSLGLQYKPGITIQAWDYNTSLGGTVGHTLEAAIEIDTVLQQKAVNESADTSLHVCCILVAVGQQRPAAALLLHLVRSGTVVIVFLVLVLAALVWWLGGTLHQRSSTAVFSLRLLCAGGRQGVPEPAFPGRSTRRDCLDSTVLVRGISSCCAVAVQRLPAGCSSSGSGYTRYSHSDYVMLALWILMMIVQSSKVGVTVGDELLGRVVHAPGIPIDGIEPTLQRRGVVPRVGERTREGKDFCHKMIVSGVIQKGHGARI